jgi:hypothetical protein
LHIGAEEIVFIRDIVAIMDIERTTTSNTTRGFLKACEEKGMVVSVGDDIPKSFIVTIREGKQKVYLSPISSTTLYKRTMKQTKDNRRN